MASAQVLPNSVASSRKQGHLEAGKRRLEEFRKKRAEVRGKKVTSQLQSTEFSQDEKLPQENALIRFSDSDGTATSEREGAANSEPSDMVTIADSKAIHSLLTGVLGTSNETRTGPPVMANNHDALYTDLVQNTAMDRESKQGDDGMRLPRSIFGSYDFQKKEKNIDLGTSAGTQGGLAYGMTTDHYMTKDSLDGIRYIDGNIHQSNINSANQSRSKEIENSSRENSVKDSDSSLIRTSLTDSAIEVERNMHGSVNFNSTITSNMGGRKLGTSTDHRADDEVIPWRTSEALSMDFSLDPKSSSNHGPLYSTSSETATRRSRPSFLDSLNVSRASSVSHFPFMESDKTEPFMSKSSKVHNADIPASSGSRHPFVELDTVRPFAKFISSDVQSKYEPSMSSSLSVKNDEVLLKDSVKENSMEKMREFPSLKQDEDFSALEQHIEDLTQEKFSLQRALDASRVLAESLALENSSLTDSFNQQGLVVNQLKHDVERLQDEIKAQLLELESIKMEYANAHLECNASDERAKILASEVIGLEEKALRLRSRELKLERQLENTNAEFTSYKKKVSSLEKDRQDLQSTIDALQEEKKLLQTKLRKASTSGKSANASKTPSISKDVSTSTEDLGVEVLDMMFGEDSGVDSVRNILDHEMQHPASFSSNDMPSVSENRQFHLPVESVSIPPDQLKTIGNINSLITELSLEKEELIQALATESSQSLKMKDLNKELSRKLEAQTQRLELLTAQSMANENIPARQISSRTMPDSSAYTDEGDEVVERVLGWIMKLFPGGPSKRRTSKLL